MHEEQLAQTKRGVIKEKVLMRKSRKHESDVYKL